MDLLDSVKLPKYVYEDGKPRQNVWDTSSLSSFLACPRLYNLTNLNGYKMKSYGTVTGFGSAVHDGFEILDTGKFNKEGKELLYIIKYNFSNCQFTPMVTSPFFMVMDSDGHCNTE